MAVPRPAPHFHPQVLRKSIEHRLYNVSLEQGFRSTPDCAVSTLYFLLQIGIKPAFGLAQWHEYEPRSKTFPHRGTRDKRGYLGNKQIQARIACIAGDQIVEISWGGVEISGWARLPKRHICIRCYCRSQPPIFISMFILM